MSAELLDSMLESPPALAVPILSWLPKYDWKKNILYDVIAGFTVAIMHIPQVCHIATSFITLNSGT
jgi:MFS superfamily sulfate permease-like transporter